MTTMAVLTTLRSLQRSRPLARRAALWVHPFSSDASSQSPSDGNETAAPKLPEHIKFRMPDLDFEQISGGPGGVTLSKWHVREGDVIKDGVHMCEIDTPDLVFVLDAGDEGYLARILVPAETEDVPPGQPLAIIVPKEADIDVFRAALQQHPRAIEGYVEPTDAEISHGTKSNKADGANANANTNASANTNTNTNVSTEKTEKSETTSSYSENDDGAAVLRALHKLHKDGHFADDAVFKVLKSLARKNDAQLLVTYRGSFDGDAFDAAFFIETATELAQETSSSN